MAVTVAVAVAVTLGGPRMGAGGLFGRRATTTGSHDEGDGVGAAAAAAAMRAAGYSWRSGSWLLDGFELRKCGSGHISKQKSLGRVEDEKAHPKEGAAQCGASAVLVLCSVTSEIAGSLNQSIADCNGYAIQLPDCICLYGDALSTAWR